MNGNEGPGPLLIKGRRELLKQLLKLQCPNYQIMR
jgi:hypothetical protein